MQSINVLIILCCMRIVSSEYLGTYKEPSLIQIRITVNCKTISGQDLGHARLSIGGT